MTVSVYYEVINGFLMVRVRRPNFDPVKLSSFVEPFTQKNLQVTELFKKTIEAPSVNVMP